jgi:hypothetical protein
MLRSFLYTTACCVVLLFSFTADLHAYSVLTHEAIVDSAWDQSIAPLLRQRFPGATPEELKKAHAYAYGGSIIQDVGYYPFGSHFFTDLTHYVRPADFVATMLRDARNITEYAFALGALAHYAADTVGHPLGINRSVPLLYPKLRIKHGDEVAYAADPGAHLKTEFGFDVLQVAQGRYAPDAYRDFIGFEISKPLLERAFTETYGLELDDVFAALDLAIGTYRKSVSAVIPKMTKVAWELKRGDIQKSTPGITRDMFLFNLSRAEYEKTWGKEYREPGFGAKILAFAFRIIPKVGPLKVLRFRLPTPEAERLFMDSFNKTVQRYRELISAEASNRAPYESTNMNLDVGQPTTAGMYELSDKTYLKLVHELSTRRSSAIPPKLREAILNFYQDESTATASDPKKWQQLQRELQWLKGTASRPSE